MAADVRPLVAVLAAVPDPRNRRGRRHPLAAILALSCAATLCGARSYSAIAEWGRDAGAAFAEALGFTRQTTPCAATFFLLFRRLDWDAFERVLAGWAEAVLAATPVQEGRLEGIAIDGKTLRGSRKQGAVAVHLLSAVSHRLGLTLGQRAVADHTNEIPVVLPLLRGLLLEGRVVTVDALLTQHEVARTIRAGGGDYVMPVKENQPQLLADITMLFASPPRRATRPGAPPTPGTQGTVAASSAP